MTNEQKAEIERCARIVYLAEENRKQLEIAIHYDGPREQSFVDIAIAEAELSAAKIELSKAQAYRLPDSE